MRRNRTTSPASAATTSVVHALPSPYRLPSRNSDPTTKRPSPGPVALTFSSFLRASPPSATRFRRETFVCRRENAGRSPFFPAAPFRRLRALSSSNAPKKRTSFRSGRTFPFVSGGKRRTDSVRPVPTTKRTDPNEAPKRRTRTICPERIPVGRRTDRRQTAFARIRRTFDTDTPPQNEDPAGKTRKDKTQKSRSLCERPYISCG